MSHLIPKQKEIAQVQKAFTVWQEETDQHVERNNFFLGTKFEKEFIVRLFMGQDAGAGESSFF